MASSEQLEPYGSSEEIADGLEDPRDNPQSAVIAHDFEERVRRHWVRNNRDDAPSQETAEQVGRYQIRRAIGRGGFGVVYLANDPTLKREVALKVPLLGHLEEPRQRERFLAEARAAASLQHRYVMPIYDAGEAEGVGYLAMRNCSMGTLANWLSEQDAPIPPRTAAALMQAICEGVGHAHDKNIIHRDLKPANILLDEAPADSPLREFGLSFIPLVSDFGMAKLAGWDDPEIRQTQLTRTGTRIGTPCYMPPEHATGRAKESQKSADVYGLGVMLFELLTGHPPFTGESDYEVLHQVVTAEPASIRKYRPDVPITLERICRKCLEKSPDRRCRDANELGKDLAHFLAGERIANLPWIKGSLVRTTLVPAVLSISILLLCIAAWFTPSLMDTSLFAWRRELPIPVVNAPLGGYASAIENALPTATGVIDDDSRRLLDNPGFVEQHRDILGFEWRYARQKARRDHFLASHSGDGWAISYSPDGKWMAENSSEPHVYLWDTASETLVKRLQANYTLASYCLAFSPDSQWLAASQRDHFPNAAGMVGSVQIWNLAEQASIWNTGLQADILQITGMTFSKNGEWLYLHGIDTENRGAIWKCNRDSANVAWKWTSAQGTIHDMVESDKEGELWLCQTVEDAPMPKTSILALKMPIQETRAIVPEFVGRPVFARFSPNASHCVMGECYPNTPKQILDLGIYDLKKGRMIDWIREPYGELEAFTFEQNTDNIYVVCTGSLEPNANRIIRKWDATAGTLSWVRALPPGMKVTAMTTSPNGESLVLRRAADPRIHFVELEGTTTTEIHGHYPKETWSIAFSEDSSRLLSGGDDGLVREWDVSDGHLLDEFDTHLPQLVTTAAYEPGNPSRVATGSFDRTVQLWTIENPDRSIMSLPHDALVRKLAFLPRGRSIVTIADDFCVRSWNPDSGEMQWQTQASQRKLRCVAVHPNGHEIAVAGNDGILRILSAENGAKLREAASSSSEIWSLVYSPIDDSWLVGTKAGSIERLHRDGSNFIPWNISTSGILELAMSPEGKTLVSANSEGEIEMWQVATGSSLGILDLVHQATHALTFSPDGHHLAAGLHDGSIRMWNAPNPPPRAHRPEPTTMSRTR